MKRGTLAFDITRQSVYRIITKALKPLDPNAKPHSLRHYRLTHLALHYDFKGHELSQIAGWSTRTGFALAGEVTSSNVNVNLHLGWKQYLPKLFVPLNEVISTFSAPSPKDLESLDEETEEMMPSIDHY